MSAMRTTPVVRSVCALLLSLLSFAAFADVFRPAYLELRDGAFILKERAPGVSVEEIVSKTAGKLIVPEHVPEMQFSA